MGEQGGDLRIHIGLVPHGTRKDGALILVTCGTERAVGIPNGRRSVGPIVAHNLELEPPRRFVITDDFQDSGFFMVADEKPVFEVHAR